MIGRKFLCSLSSPILHFVEISCDTVVAPLSIFRQVLFSFFFFFWCCISIITPARSKLTWSANVEDGGSYKKIKIISLLATFIIVYSKFEEYMHNIIPSSLPF